MKNSGKIKPGQHLSKETEFKKGHIPHNKGKKALPLSKKMKAKLKKCINKHHIDLNKDNNHLDNCMFLSVSNHRKIHARAYDFLVELGLIAEYIDWFKNKYKPKEFTLEQYLNNLSRTRKFSEAKLMKQNKFNLKNKPVKLENIEDPTDYFIFKSSRAASKFLGLNPTTTATNINLGHNTKLNNKKYKPAYITKEEYLWLELQRDK